MKRLLLLTLGLVAVGLFASPSEAQYRRHVLSNGHYGHSGHHGGHYYGGQRVVRSRSHHYGHRSHYRYRHSPRRYYGGHRYRYSRGHSRVRYSRGHSYGHRGYGYRGSRCY